LPGGDAGTAGLGRQNMAKVLGRNKHQKAAHKVGEPRVGREQLDELLELSRSAEAGERLEAAKLLCPCHVRRRVEPVWEALYRLLEDPVVEVRRAAWHTLEDGGRPDDPKLDAVLQRVLKTETDRTVLSFAAQIGASRNTREMTTLRAAATRAPRQRGKCDFCGEMNVFVDRDLETMIPTDGLPRPALACDRCSQAR
jgi:hypothetical protein